MWKFKRELIDRGRIHKVSIFGEDRQVTYSQVIELWQQDRSFREFFISLLADTPMTAYFWETPPVTEATVERVFELVLIDSPKLADIDPDPSDFKQHFSSAQEIVTFPNLGNDALLVVPCPIAKIPSCTHLASFVREAHHTQQHLLWQTIGRSLKQRLNEQPIWVSTSGLGVHWLHVRLDSCSKYYCFEPYKQRLN